MTGKQLPQNIVVKQVSRYENGVNVIMGNTSGKSVSVCRTDYGLWDVATDDGRYPYTGYDGKRAGRVVREELE